MLSLQWQLEEEMLLLPKQQQSLVHAWGVGSLTKLLNCPTMIKEMHKLLYANKVFISLQRQ